MPKLSSEIVFVLYFSLFFKYIIIFLSEIISMKFTSAIKSILLLLVHLLRLSSIAVFDRVEREIREYREG